MPQSLICIDTALTMPIASSVAPTSPVRILVVDDHTLFRRGLTALLSREARFEVVGDAADAGEALRRVQELQPDLILLDNHLPGVRGVDALPALREAAPSARVLMLTVSEDERDLADALKAGAAGYLLKTVEGDALAAAIHRVMRGESVVADEMTSKLVAAFKGASNGGVPTHLPTAAAPAAATSLLNSLSPRERDILRGMARGASNKEIGRELGIAETTVKIHVQHVLRKLGVSSRVHAAVLATENGLT